MRNNILKDLTEKYFQGIADDISNAKVISSIFPNMTDIGDVRELVLLKFLQSHLPSRCVVIKGGCIFDPSSNASKQMDLLVVNDFSLKFSYFDQHAQHSKNIQTVEGCIAAISVKSTLDKKELHEALSNLASIPKMPDYLLKNIDPRITIREKYLKLPLKIVFAFSGQSVKKTVEDINNFYTDNYFEQYQKADCVVVNNSFCIQKTWEGGAQSTDGIYISEGTYCPMTTTNKKIKGALPLFWLLMEMQEAAQFSPRIHSDYRKYFESMIQ